MYLINLGLNSSRIGETGGEVFLERAIQLDPDNVDAHVSLAEVLLAQWDWQRGWREYHWRWRQPDFLRLAKFAQPQWDGGPLAGKTILVHAEQGFGDTLQFARFLPAVAERAFAVIFEVQPALFPIVEKLPGVACTVRKGVDPLPSFDVHCPLLSLPFLLEAAPDMIPSALALPAFTTEPWSKGARDLRVGLAWAGNPGHKRDGFRSMPLDDFLPLQSIPGITFVSLQRDLRPGDAETLQSFPMEHPINQNTDFLATKRAVESLDLLVSVDTGVAHLAATLNKPVLLLLAQAADWRWGHRGETTPWYPSMRLIRRKSEADRASQIDQVAKHLIDLLANDSTPLASAAPISFQDLTKIPNQRSFTQ